MIPSINSILKKACEKGALVGAMGIAIGMLTAACGSDTGAGGENSSEPRPLNVVTTLYPLEHFAERIGGDTVTVTNLVPPGVEAHDFEPSPSDVRKLNEADVIIYNGLGFEPWVERALGAIGDGSRIVVKAGLTGSAKGAPEDAGPAGTDPHVWLDPLGATEQVELIEDGLAVADPDSSDAYAVNAQALADELSALHQRFVDGLTECRFRYFVTSHSAFGQLAQRYDLEQLSISGISPEAQPSPGELAAMADRIKALGVEYVMVEPVVSSELPATLAREVGAELLSLHPLEALTPEEARRGETYFTLMEANLQNLRLALECQ